MRRRLEELEGDFIAGRLEGQTKKPRFTWCECVRWTNDMPEPNPKCKKCHGTGMIERGASSHR